MNFSQEPTALYHLKTVAEYAERYRIPLFLYKNKQAFIALDKKKALTYDDYIDFEVEEDTEEVMTSETKKYREILNNLLTKDPKTHKLTKDEEEMLLLLQSRGPNPIEYQTKLFMPYDDELAYNLPRFMRRHGIKQGSTLDLESVLLRRWGFL